MRRAPYVAGATILGMVGILTFHSQGATSTLLGPPKAQSGAKSPATPTPSVPPSTPSTSPPTTGSPAPGQSGSTSNSATPSAPAVRTATGPNEQYGYGVLAVQVTVTGTTITDVSVQNLQTAEQYSQQLAQQVIPMLRSEVLQAQSANINGISGATYTGQAYATSLQAALDTLHFH